MVTKADKGIYQQPLQRQLFNREAPFKSSGAERRRGVDYGSLAFNRIAVVGVTSYFRVRPQSAIQKRRRANALESAPCLKAVVGHPALKIVSFASRPSTVILLADRTGCEDANGPGSI